MFGKTYIFVIGAQYCHFPDKNPSFEPALRMSICIFLARCHMIRYMRRLSANRGTSQTVQCSQFAIFANITYIYTQMQGDPTDDDNNETVGGFDGSIRTPASGRVLERAACFCRGV